MNILITSAGTRGYLIRYFKEALKEKGKIFAADCSKYAPALYNADNYFIVPTVSDKNYIDELAILNCHFSRNIKVNLWRKVLNWLFQIQKQ